MSSGVFSRSDYSIHGLCCLLPPTSSFILSFFPMYNTLLLLSKKLLPLWLCVDMTKKPNSLSLTLSLFLSLCVSFSVAFLWSKNLTRSTKVAYEIIIMMNSCLYRFKEPITDESNRFTQDGERKEETNYRPLRSRNKERRGIFSPFLMMIVRDTFVWPSRSPWKSRKKNKGKRKEDKKQECVRRNQRNLKRGKERQRGEK